MAAAKVIDITQYSNCESILRSSSLAKSNEYEAIKDLVNLGYAHAQHSARYKVDLAKYVSSWEDVLSKREKNCSVLRTNSGIFVLPAQYTTMGGSILSKSCKECEARRIDDMKSNVPGVYAVWGATCILLAAVFTTLFIIGIVTGLFIFSPWVNLALSIASIGMTATVIVAIFDRRKKLNDRQKQKEQQRGNEG